jgi:hypothetical protein
MSSAPAPLPSNEARGRLVLLFVGAVCIIGLLVLAIAFLWPSTSDGASTHSFDAGAASAFQPGSIHYFEDQHLYVVRRSDSSFIALYDWDSWAQFVYQAGEADKAHCRVRITEEQLVPNQGTLQLIRAAYPIEQGLENVVLRSGCEGSAFDPLGRHGFGPAYDLDRFPVYVATNGHVIVTLSQRQCPPEAPCLPYQ